MCFTDKLLIESVFTVLLMSKYLVGLMPLSTIFQLYRSIYLYQYEYSVDTNTGFEYNRKCVLQSKFLQELIKLWSIFSFKCIFFFIPPHDRKFNMHYIMLLKISDIILLTSILYKWFFFHFQIKNNSKLYKTTSYKQYHWFNHSEKNSRTVTICFKT